MSFSLIYLAQRALFRIWEFIRDWYGGVFRIMAHRTIAVLESFDRTFALKVTLRHFFEPLYGDRTMIGYMLGIPFRLARVILAALIYCFVVALALFLYALWALAPFFILFWNNLSISR